MKPTSAARERLAAAGRGLALALVVGPFAPPVARAAPPGGEAQAPAQVIDHNSRSFRIPFNIDPAERARIKEVLLTVSDDQGRTWTPISRTTPDKPALAYRAKSDGEYWFAVQTMDTEGRLYPANSASIEPRMKVVVDTIPPSLTLRPNSRSGSLASVRWEIRDERLDRASFSLEYQAEGAGDWRQVPIKKPAALIGEVTWDAGTAEPIRVRAAVSDRAGNVRDASLSLRDGTPDNPDAARPEASAPPELTEPPPLGSFTSASVPPTPRTRPQSQSPPRPSPPPAGAADAAPAPSAYNPFEPASGGGGPALARAPASVGGDANPKPRLIPGPRFDLRYEVEDAGPDGPATVELWVTQNGGRTWSLMGDDPDRRSPFPVVLGGDGVFGLTLVAKSASNEGDQPPGPGDPPQYLVEVDTTPPVVQLDRVLVGGGTSAGKISIEWHAADLHLNDRPVVISVRPDTPGSAWVPINAEAIKNSGKFVWTVPPTAPARFHVRVDVADSVGNRGSDETREGSPVLIDRTRPKSRIIGLDPSALNATGPAPNPFAERPTTRE